MSNIPTSSKHEFEDVFDNKENSVNLLTTNKIDEQIDNIQIHESPM